MNMTVEDAQRFTDRHWNKVSLAIIVALVGAIAWFVKDILLENKQQSVFMYNLDKRTAVIEDRTADLPEMKSSIRAMDKRLIRIEVRQKQDD